MGIAGERRIAAPQARGRQRAAGRPSRRTAEWGSPVSPPRAAIWRHGRTAWTAEGRFQGQADPPLDDVGIAQARASAALLAGFPVTTIISSDLQRAAQTADALSGRTGIPVVLDERLRERSLGHW